MNRTSPATSVPSAVAIAVATSRVSTVCNLLSIGSDAPKYMVSAVNGWAAGSTLTMLPSRNTVHGRFAARTASSASSFWAP